MDRTPQPNRIIPTQGRTLRLKKSITIDMVLVGGPTQQDLLVYIAPSDTDSGIAMHVDVVFPKWSPWPNLGFSQDLRGYIDAHRQVLDYDFEYFLGGHFGVGNWADVEESMRFTEDLFDA